MTRTSRHQAEITRMERILRSYGGVLTRERLFLECGANHWPALDSFNAALAGAILAGRVRALGTELLAVPMEK